MDLASGVTAAWSWASPVTPVADRTPATVVEPATASIQGQTAQDAGVDARTPQARALDAQTMATTTAQTMTTTTMAAADAEPDPEAPTGPPPAFDMSPLEARAALLLAPPSFDAGAAGNTAASTASAARAEDAQNRLAEAWGAASGTAGATGPTVDLLR